LKRSSFTCNERLSSLAECGYGPEHVCALYESKDACLILQLETQLFVRNYHFVFLQFVPHLKGLKQEQMEQILDRFDARQEVVNGHVLVNQGDLVGYPNIPVICQSYRLSKGVNTTIMLPVYPSVETMIQPLGLH
jgi:hypothetical protein